MKDVIRTVLIFALVVAAVYYAFIVRKVNVRMDFLNAQDSIHTVMNEDFERKLHDLELQFIGRGKHIQQFQRDLKNLDLKLAMTSDMLLSRIDSLGLIISEFRMYTESSLENLKDRVDQNHEEILKTRREATRTTTDLQVALSRLNRELGDLDKKVKEIEGQIKPRK